MIPPLHLITDDAILTRSDFPDVARIAMSVGRDGVALHLRGPGLEGRKVFELAKALREEAAESGALLLVNDRLDVALALDLPGAHLGQRSLPPGVARELLGPDRILGLSVHDRVEAGEAGEGQVDFLIVGTLFPTPSHPSAVPGGPERLVEISSSSPLPLIGIGGITPGRVEAVLRAGAHGMAVRGGVWETPDPAGAVGVYLQKLGWPTGRGRPGGETKVDSTTGNAE